MTALVNELGFHPELLRFLDEHDVRFEVIDGSIVVSPPPGFRHEVLVIPLGAQLLAAAPREVAVLGSGYRFYYEPTSFLMADLTVARREDCQEHGMQVAPLLVIEILSPGTRRRDLTRKREIYEQAGVPSYWVVDPVAPTLTVLSLQDGSYVETGRLAGAGELTVERPFEVTVRLFRR